MRKVVFNMTPAAVPSQSQLQKPLFAGHFFRQKQPKTPAGSRVSAFLEETLCRR
jgi:hypothetical protein